MIRRFQRNAANGVFHTAEALDADLDWILCMSWFWEFRKCLARAMLEIR